MRDTCCCPRIGWVAGKEHTDPCRAQRTHHEWFPAHSPTLSSPPYAADPPQPLPFHNVSSASPWWGWSGTWASQASPCSQWAEQTLERNIRRNSISKCLVLIALFLCFVSTHLPISSSRKLHQCPGYWRQSSWCYPGAEWDVPRWHPCTDSLPALGSSLVLSPTSGADSCTAWAGWSQSRGASLCNGPQTLPDPRSLSTTRPAQGCPDTVPALDWADPGLKHGW